MTSITMHLKKRGLLDSHDRLVTSVGSRRDKFSSPEWKQVTDSSIESATSEASSSSRDDRISLSTVVLGRRFGEPESSQGSKASEEVSRDDSGSLSGRTSMARGTASSNGSTLSDEEHQADGTHPFTSSTSLQHSPRSDDSQLSTTHTIDTKLVSPPAVAPSVPPTHLVLPIRRRRRRSKISSPWNFTVGDYADECSHGRSSVGNACWSQDDFDVIHELGGGEFGHVMLAEELVSGTYVALKRIEKTANSSSSHCLECLKREIKIQTSVRHEHILQSFGYFSSQSAITLVLEYAEHGNLYEYVYDNGKLSVDHAAHLVWQVVSAMAHLESLHIAHRDVKAENVVLLSTSWKAKLCDFGYAVRAPPPHDRRTTRCGTPEFVPPEVVTGKEYAARHVDPWALGVLTYELVNGSSPFYVEKSERARIAKERGYAELYYVTFERIRSFTTFEPSVEFADEKYCNFLDFCSLLLQRNPSDRMSAADALNHPWLVDANRSVSSSASRRHGSSQSRRAKRIKTNAS